MNFGHIVSNNIDVEQIRNKYNISENYIKDLCTVNGKIKKFFVSMLPDSCKHLIVHLYTVEGLNSYKIAEVYKISYKSVVKVLDEYGINRIYSGGSRKYTFNEHYFDVIDTNNKAYILGFLYADGYNGVDRNIVSINLQERDKELLDKIKIELDSNNQLTYLDYSHYNDGVNMNAQNQYKLTLHSAILCKALNDLGCTQRKSLTLQFPCNLRKDLYSHFIRGYFDGDGCIGRYKRNDGKGYNYEFQLMSTCDFLSFVQKCIIQDVGVQGGGIHSTSSYDNGITKSLRICGKQQVKKVMDWLYNDAEIYLEREYNRYIEYFYNDVDTNESLLD